MFFNRFINKRDSRERTLSEQSRFDASSVDVSVDLFTQRNKLPNNRIFIRENTGDNVDLADLLLTPTTRWEVQSHSMLNEERIDRLEIDRLRYLVAPFVTVVV